MKKKETLTICVSEKVEVTDTFGYATFSCTDTKKKLVVNAPEFYEPVHTYWANGLARGPSVLSYDFIKVLNGQPVS